MVSSLAFDTIYAEGQRRYVETLSTYARQFLDQMERPDVDSIDGLSPAISIEQAGRGFHRRAEPGHFDRTEDHQPQPALDRGDHHGDLRLPAAAVLVDRHAALPVVRQRDLAADHRADPAARVGAAAGRPHYGAGAGGARAQGRVQEGPGEAGAPGIRAGADRWRAALARRGYPAGPAPQPHDRGGGGPVAAEAGYREAPGGFHRNRHQAGGRPGADRGGERRGAPLLAEAGVHGVRHQRAAARAALEPRSFSFNSPYGACEECTGLGSKWAFD